MKLTRMTQLTLGVRDLEAATRFYAGVFDCPANTSYENVVFFELPGTWISLYPLDELSRDISPDIETARAGFRGFTMAHNVGSKAEVTAVVERARSAGASVVKEPQEVFWGGFHAYFADPDGYYWEIAWGPMFEICEDGELRFKKNA